MPYQNCYGRNINVKHQTAQAIKGLKMKYVAYYRVSTKQQGKSGLGLDAQKETVKTFTNNCTGCLLGEFVEVESGKNDNREQLKSAIEFARVNGAKLLIAKLDRLSRNASFIFALRDSKIDFVCCDMPDANTLTIGIFATLAQHERELISSRTKAALSARKERVGEWRKGVTSDEARAKAVETNKRKAATNENNIRATDIAKMYRENGLSLPQIADQLNKAKFRTSRDCQFTPMSVKRLIEK